MTAPAIPEGTPLGRLYSETYTLLKFSQVHWFRPPPSGVHRPRSDQPAVATRLTDDVLRCITIRKTPDHPAQDAADLKMEATQDGRQFLNEQQGPDPSQPRSGMPTKPDGNMEQAAGSPPDSPAAHPHEEERPMTAVTQQDLEATVAAGPELQALMTKIRSMSNEELQSGFEEFQDLTQSEKDSKWDNVLGAMLVYEIYRRGQQ